LVLVLMVMAGTHIAKKKNQLPSCDASIVITTSTGRALDASEELKKIRKH
jgi:hypothetical protein